MKLTTPELKSYDSVFPGENWFFYWKTSPSLWENKLSEYNGAGPIFVPINWGFHSEHQEQYDFGNYRPETNLKRLYDVACSVGKDLIFIIPVTPAPFLPNGGIPSYLARTLSISEQGTVISALDSENRVNKVYSFFEPQVFQAYRKFSWNLGQYLSQNGMQCEVFGANFGYLKDGNFISYLEDYSVAFEQGFSRYIKQLQNTEPDEVRVLLDNPSQENKFKKKFLNLISGLYEEAASESFAASWGRVVPICLLGGSLDDIFSRSSDLWDHEANFFNPLLEILVNNLTPSSILLPPYLKNGALAKSLNDIVNSSFIRSNLENAIYESEERLSFLPLVFFEIYTPQLDSLREDNIVKDIGLTSFFNRDFQWTYRHYNHLKSSKDEENIHKVYFLFGKFIDTEIFNDILKIFMNGGRIFLDIDQLDGNLKKKIHLFINENNIQTESLNFLTNIVKAQLGDGILLIYDSSKLKEQSQIRRINFWEKVIKYLKLKHLKVQNDEDLYYLWRSRSSNTYELNYEEIRRVSFYNPTSYKKKAQVITSSNFAFLKTIDQINGQVKSTPMGVDIELLPGGSVSLDFGFYE